MDTTQVMSALARANETRLRRASLRRQCNNQPLTEGLAMIADMLEAGEWSIQTIPLLELMRWPRRYGPAHARRMIAAAGVRGETRRVCELSPRQIAVLVDLIHERAERVAA
jgi:hypothetical protein